MIYPFRCIMCGENFDVIQPMDIEHTAFHCGVKAERVWGDVNTEKDLAYSFTTDVFDGKPVQINSKGQYKTLLKQHGMADASLKECNQEARFRKRLNEEGNKNRIRESSENIYGRLRAKGVSFHGR